MAGSGTRVLIVMLMINVFLVLAGFTITDVDLVGMFNDPGSFVMNFLSLGLNIAIAPIALLTNVGIPPEIRLVFGLPMVVIYVMAWIQFIRGKFF